MSDDVVPEGFDPDAGLLEERIAALGGIGSQPEGGLYRPVYSDAWAEAVACVEGWMIDDGLRCRRDSVGNLFGRLQGRDDSAPVVLTGSHIDTVRNGGRYDGALGIHAAMAAVRTLGENFGPPQRPLEVYVICEEEGSRFPAEFWGSRALTGTIESGDVDTVVDADGVTIGDAMREQGLDPTAIPASRRNDIAAFVELHIEQGRTLIDEGMDVGVVTAITGLRQYRVEVTGRADHAGTTAMSLRRDALRAAAEMVGRVSELANEAGPPAVATVGQIEAQPGAPNVVAGRCTFTIDTRHADAAVRDRLNRDIEAALRDVAAAYDVEVRVERQMNVEPVDMTPSVVELIGTAAESEGLRHLRMPSGAGHDAMIMAQHVPTGMIFVPSVDGRSHSPAEDTPIEMAVPGVRVLTRALHELAYRNPDSG